MARRIVVGKNEINKSREKKYNVIRFRFFFVDVAAAIILQMILK